MHESACNTRVPAQLKGMAFRPYIQSPINPRALAPEGMHRHPQLSLLQPAAKLLALLLLAVPARAQHPDPAWNPSTLVSPIHTPLAEEYIWTANDAAVFRSDHAKFNYRTTEKKIEPHLFRATFTLKQVPNQATLYIAGPRAAKVWINSTQLLNATTDTESRLPSQVFSAPIQTALHPGQNTIAIEAVRGRGIVAASDAAVIQQLSFGETLVAKILPAAPGIDAAPLLISAGSWRSTTSAPDGWQQPTFDDSAWPLVQSLGPIESKPDFFQWNLDAGLYNWPGYMGLSPALRTYTVEPLATTHPLPGVPPDSSDNAHVLVDFGREIAGRLIIESASDSAARLTASYGESEQEALSGQHYLGSFNLALAPHATSRGPKSGFRYAYLQFPGPESQERIRAEGIAYPVEYKGSFRSSDPTLNRIWEAGAYTAHLCMQSGVWDAAKRDRGWWAGDLDVAGPVIASVFADSSLLNETFTHLIPPPGEHVNGIPSYTALWITALADLYRRTADPALLKDKHQAVLELLAHMDEEFDDQGKFLNKGHHWMFVDWSRDLYGQTPEAAEGTQFEMLRGYREAVWLLAQMGDSSNAARFSKRADQLTSQLRNQFAQPQGNYGDRWQLNSMAVLAGIAKPNDYAAIWSNSLGKVNADSTQTISPFFNDYVLQAMARMNHRTEAVNWLRTYWGGMMNEGATSLWEAYDLHWPKDNPHAHLEADGRVGYFASLAHAWSAGPTSWMMDELLGVHADEPGYARATIRPDLAGLEWIEGTVPTPHGPIRLSMHAAMRLTLELPTGVTATLLLPLPHANAKVQINGKAAPSAAAEDGYRAAIEIKGPGRFVVASR